MRDARNCTGAQKWGGRRGWYIAVLFLPRLRNPSVRLHSCVDSRAPSLRMFVRRYRNASTRCRFVVVVIDATQNQRTTLRRRTPPIWIDIRGLSRDIHDRRVLSLKLSESGIDNCRFRIKAQTTGCWVSATRSRADYSIVSSSWRVFVERRKGK